VGYLKRSEAGGNTQEGMKRDIWYGTALSEGVTKLFMGTRFEGEEC